jgi:hypothetical protein
LSRSAPFKGGTCLKKCYFETYRFSEDLDFTLSNAAHLDADFLKRAFSEVSEMLYEEVGLQVPAEQLRFDVYRDIRGGLSCEGRLYYDGPLQRGQRVKVLIDMNLSPHWVNRLNAAGLSAVHWSSVGRMDAADIEIMAYAAKHDYVV